MVGLTLCLTAPATLIRKRERVGRGTRSAGRFISHRRGRDSGAALGAGFGSREIIFGWTNADLAVLGGLYIRLLTALATPLIFFAIVDAFVHTRITGWQGLKMLVICGVNIAVAFAIGLTILNVWQPGRAWQGTLIERVRRVGRQAPETRSAKELFRAEAEEDVAVAAGHARFAMSPRASCSRWRRTWC